MNISQFDVTVYHIRTRPVSERNLNAIRISTHIFNFFEDCDLVVQGTIAAMHQREQIGAAMFRQKYATTHSTD